MKHLRQHYQRRLPQRFTIGDYVILALNLTGWIVAPAIVLAIALAKSS